MAMVSNTLTLDKQGLADASLGVDWVEVVEKMNSTPGTPRQEARDSHYSAEKVAAAPTSPTMTREGENTQISTKSTLRIVPSSPVPEQSIAESTPPHSPLDISIPKAGHNLQSASIQSTEALNDQSKEESGILGVQVVDVLKSNDNIPVVVNRNTEARPIQSSPSLEGTKGENETLESIPSPPSVLSIEPISKITEENDIMGPLAVEAKETRASLPEEKGKSVEVLEDTNSTSALSKLEEEKIEDVIAEVLPVSPLPEGEEQVREVMEEPVSNPLPVILEDAKMEEVLVEESSVSPSSNALVEKEKEEVLAEEPTTISQENAVQEDKKETDKNIEAETISSREEEVKKEIHTQQPMITEKTPSTSSSPKELQSDASKDASLQIPTNNPSSTSSEKENDREQNAGTKESIPGRTLSVSIPKPEKGPEDKKGLQLLTKLKRKLSTKNMKDYKQEAAPPTPTTAISSPPTPTTAVSSPSTSIEAPKHIELVQTKSKSSTDSPREGKKMDTLFRSIRAAMSFSGRRSPKSPTFPKTGQTPVPSPIATRSRTWDRKSSKPSSPTMVKTPIARPSTAKAVLKSSEKVPQTTEKAFPLEKKATLKQVKPAKAPLPKAQPSVRRPGHNSTYVKANLTTAQTWSPSGSAPVLASNPNAKMYTIWPRYPVVRDQTDEIQAVLVGFLPDHQSAIEKSFASGSNSEVVNFWKAPLTSAQAEVVKGIEFVSSIQLSKLDYDPSDYFC